MILIILTRVLLSVSGNAVQKRLLLDGMRVTPLWLITYTLMLLPGLAFAALRPAPMGSGFWLNILAGGLLDAIGNLAMVAALETTHLSIFGPLNAFRPALALFFGWLFLAEKPTLPGFAGVSVMVLGAWALFGNVRVNEKKPPGGVVWRTIMLRVTGLSMSTAGAVFLKRAAMVSSPQAALAGWIVCGLACVLIVSILRDRGPGKLIKSGLAKHSGWLVLHAFAFFVMQWITIYIFKRTLLAYSFVYFQLGMVLQVFIGALIFKEPAFKRRLAACGIMSLGAALIAWKG